MNSGRHFSISGAKVIYAKFSCLILDGFIAIGLRLGEKVFLNAGAQAVYIARDALFGM